MCAIIHMSHTGLNAGPHMIVKQDACLQHESWHKRESRRNRYKAISKYPKVFLLSILIIIGIMKIFYFKYIFFVNHTIFFVHCLLHENDHGIHTINSSGTSFILYTCTWNNCRKNSAIIIDILYCLKNRSVKLQLPRHYPVQRTDILLVKLKQRAKLATN